MIIAYLAGIPAYYEGEDIEIRYSIYENDKLICKKAYYQDFVKPAVVGLKAIIALFDELQKIDSDNFTVIINDPALNELIKGTSTTKNGEVLKVSSMARRKLQRFPKEVLIKDISTNHLEILKWDEALKA
ncbi:hypothetical protein GC105_12990 [Alkalibaculum sp. M08DMB]|uniref:Uncharacterized protein n=1 Tax=Alkalibaculum sporogenes TaxID=2655001 RepID=A0A6A7KBD0_9FIRM|nr:hypothetical protein [Alkalibaculum sporogenes]MPW26706.1 hypothetical protein [Alkalibaculum sporogenes]